MNTNDNNIAIVAGKILTEAEFSLKRSAKHFIR